MQGNFVQLDFSLKEKEDDILEVTSVCKKQRWGGIQKGE